MRYSPLCRHVAAREGLTAAVAAIRIRLVSVDEPRLLHRTRGYTNNPNAALPAEPEAVDADYQQLITERARRDHRDQVLTEWSKTRARITTAVDHFTSLAAADPGLRRQLRLVSRGVHAVDQHLLGP